MGLVVLCGCATVKMTEQASKVKIVNPDQVYSVRECKRIGRINAKTDGFFDVHTSDDELEVDLMNRLKVEASNQSGNVIVTKQRVTESAGVAKPVKQMKGVAYRCPAAIFSSLHSSEDF